MSTLRVCSVLATLALLGACTTTGRGAAPHAGNGDARDAQDTVRLTNGDVVQGRILEDSGRQIVIDRETVVSAYPRSAIFSIDYAKRAAPLQMPESVPDATRPATTWIPRTDPRDPLQQTEVLFHDTHAVVDCLGSALAKTHQELPDLRLFVEPGGKILLHDPKQWGYHAHLSGGALRIPAGKPGLTIDMAKDEAALPESVAFVSPAQEIKAGEGEGRSSYALPDAVFAALKPLSVAEALLSVQPFAGGKPATTPNGSLWAFTLPRNARQFFVYLFDPTRKHGEILKASYIAFGETIFAADLMIDVVGVDGLTLGRVLVVPFPENLSADGPAREPLTIFAGPLKDPTAITTLALPPREAIQLPTKAAATKADVLVSHYEVSNSVPQAVVLAHGLGRPNKDVTIVTRELTPADPDLIAKIDVSALPEERFPAVAWLYQRRSYIWKTTGGYLPRVPVAEIPPRREARLVKVRKSDAIPHVIPLLFVGPKPRPAVERGIDPAAQIAGGMASGLLREGLSRGSNMTQTITPAPAAESAGASEKGSVSNVTYVYITSPPHTPGSDLAPQSSQPNGSNGTLYGQHYNSWGTGGRMFAAPGSAGTGPGGFVMQPVGSQDMMTGATYGTGGGVIYNPQTGTTSDAGAPDRPANMGYNVGGVVVPIRRVQR
jgi:hypothetical protein